MERQIAEALRDMPTDPRVLRAEIERYAPTALPIDMMGEFRVELATMTDVAELQELLALLRAAKVAEVRPDISLAEPAA